VYAARVDASGSVLDPGGFSVASEPLGGGQPGVASDGVVFMVAWPSNVPQDPYESDIRSARVSADAVVLDPSGIDVSLAVSRQVSPSVAARDGLFLVVWEDYRAGTCDYDRCLYGDVFANRIPRNGIPLDGWGFRLFPTDLVSEFRPGAVWQGDAFLVGWESYRDPKCQIYPFACADGEILGARVSETGGVIDQRPRDLAPGTTGETVPDVILGSSAGVLTYQRRGDAGIHGGANRAFLRFLPSGSPSQ
jgi:hypothetical protein